MTQLLHNSEMQETEVLTLEITDLARGGAGVSRDVDGRVVFVPFTAPGDRVRVRIVESEKRYAQGELVEILEKSSIRQDAKCPVFGQCGGCQWQHLPYLLQWETKVRGVRHALDRVKVEAPTNWDELPAEKIWEYRNRIQLRGEGKNLGFYAPRSHRLVPIDRCAIAHPQINESWEETRKQGAQRRSPYKVEVEVSTAGEVHRTWNSSHGALGFRQVHDEQNEKLRKWIAQNLSPNRVLYDFFGGTGNLSLDLASRMKEVHCVDVSAPASGQVEAPLNYAFHRSAVMPWLLRKTHLVEGSQTHESSAIFDPPREGLADQFVEIAAAIDKLGVSEMIVVGCDPDAWARDLSRWSKRGWKIEKFAVLDLFPQTPHVESIALLRL